MGTLRTLLDAGSRPSAERVMVGAAELPDSRENTARALAPARWNWADVRRVLVVRLRSIGDTVLSTPSLHALRRFLPHAQIHILVEDWVAPLLEGCADVNRVIPVERKSKVARLRVARLLRSEGYHVTYNFHGGSTSALLVRASGAPHRVGFAHLAYSCLYNHRAPPSSALWQRDDTHSAEHQLALVGWTGVPVSDRPPSQLPVNTRASDMISLRLAEIGLGRNCKFALIHSAAATDTKTWAAENFARVIEHLAGHGLPSVAVATPHQANTINELGAHARAPFAAFTDLSLPELTALAARASLFVGNDSGVAHIAAAVGTPQVVVFGSSSVAHWRPWTQAPAEVVREAMPCAPCPGYVCSEFGEPQCIRRVPVGRVIAAIERVLVKSSG